MTDPQKEVATRAEKCANAAYRAVWDIVNDATDDEEMSDLAATEAYNTTFDIIASYLPDPEEEE